MENDYKFGENAMVLAVFWLCTLVFIQVIAVNFHLIKTSVYEGFWLMMNFPIFFAAAASGIAIFAKDKGYIR